MDEKLKKALECCSRVNCCACPKLKDVNCMSNLYAETKRYIDDLEERIAIMQESMEALEKRCKTLDALEERCNALEKRNEPIEPIKPEELWICGVCGEGTVGWDDWIIGKTRNNYCPNCGQAVKWE